MDSPLFDGRETASGLLAEVNLQNLPYRVEQLEMGDVRIGENLSIEIKRNADLRLSILDGRYKSQIKRCQENKDQEIYIVQIDANLENSNRAFYSGYFTEKTYIAVQHSLALQGIALFETHSMQETVTLIYTLWERAQKKKTYISPFNRRAKAVNLRDKQIYLLMGLEGVGAEMAQKLLAYYNDPLHVFQLIEQTVLERTKGGNYRKLLNVPSGIGPQFIAKNQQLLIHQENK